MSKDAKEKIHGENGSQLISPIKILPYPFRGCRRKATAKFEPPPCSEFVVSLDKDGDGFGMRFAWFAFPTIASTWRFSLS